MVKKLGIVGLSPGNGHPFSFSAIINGYDAAYFQKSGWQVILDYLEAQPRNMIGLEHARVTHAWTQDPALTDQLCQACLIGQPVRSLQDMCGEVDAVLIARDDHETHGNMARIFLETGLTVFVDKPLTLDSEELRYFMPFIEKGQLMSASGFRYAAELDPLRDIASTLGAPLLIQAAVVNGFDKYGIHMLEAAAGIGLPFPDRIRRLAAPYESFVLSNEQTGYQMLLHCLGDVPKTFSFGVWGQAGASQVEFTDNFTAFRRLLLAFLEMVETKTPPFPPAETARLMHILMAGSRLKPDEMACLDT